MKQAPVLDSAQLWWCFVPVTLALLPHVPRLPVVLPIGFVLMLGWRWAGALERLPLPDKQRQRALYWLLQVLAIAAFAAIYFAYPGRLGRDAGVAMLTAMAGLKLVELRTARDYYALCFLTYFLVVTNFLFSQAIASAIYLFGVVVLTTAALVRLNAPARLSARDCVGLGGRMVLESLPLMLAMFVLFPRLPGPLWGVPTESDAAVTGLSDEMTIGRITRLGSSEEVAFRATFDGTPPSARDLYWRGPVLWQTDGRSWRAGTHDLLEGPEAHADGPQFHYSVLLEPHGQRWLPALDAVIGTDAAARLGRARTLLTEASVKRRARYTAVSAPSHSVGRISPTDREAALALPPRAHPQARALAAEWQAVGKTPTQRVEAALALFAAEPFVYTLTPAPLPDDPIDGFLFRTREGFCEHYAAAFVVLMRAAGVPARVVTGYQGGEFNPVSKYVLVRQSDAHAWAEIYDDTRGWLRVDPVGAVAPQRVSLGINALPQRGGALAMLEREGGAYQLWQGARRLWDAVNYQWSEWVLGYTAERQRSFLEALGMDEVTVQRLVASLALVMGGLVGGLALLLLRRPPLPGDRVQALWFVFCQRLARIGLARLPAEGPLEFAARIGTLRQDLAHDVTEIAQLYAGLRYGAAGEGVALLQRRVGTFRPRRERPAVNSTKERKDR